MASTESVKAENTLLCDIPLCDKRAEWKTAFFAKVQYYCDRHKPAIPNTLLKRVGGPKKERGTSSA